MTILQIGVLAALAVVVGRLQKGRQLALLAVNATAVFWLQPAEPVSALTYWLPVATLAIACGVWAVTDAADNRLWSRAWPAAAVLAGVVGGISAGRYLGLNWSAALAAPHYPIVLLFLGGATAAALALNHWRSSSRALTWIVAAGLVVVFIVLKSPPIAAAMQAWLLQVRPPAGEDAPAAPLTWLGFSYLAFRLLHALRDRLAGRLPATTLAEFVNYVCFFPTLTAGPIDRLERFTPELRAPIALQNRDWIDAATRIILGLFKKFVLADLLAGISISEALVPHVRSAGWMWVFLYAYAFRIYLDFSGYTDVAIGMGRLMGVRLPENFNSPYLKPNIALFWNSWHMTLTQWFRAYVFNPLTRRLRSASKPMPVWLIIFVAQVSTMVLIGLWHGITWGFAAWGLWHGLGLFAHNRWVSSAGNRLPAWTESPRWQLVTKTLGVFATFNFVSVGWLFFEISSPAVAWQAIMRMVGAG